MKKILAMLATLMLVVGLLPAVAAAADSTFTLMVYMCGTDLESDGGAATADLREMVASGIPSGGNLTVYIQTGGTKQWATRGITNGESERWLVSEEGLRRVDSLGRADMGSADTFADFMQFGFANFPADRYGLILWDHGSGATDGICFDELTGNSLNMSKIYHALSEVSSASNYRKFSFVGFDACLMAHYEMALHLAPYADYMVASEELEPGEGWDYTGWLPTLAKNPGTDIKQVGMDIIDSFVTRVEASGYGDLGTLSMIDLGKLEPLRASIERMGEALQGQLASGNFNALSRIRQNVRSFGETFDAASDMIDLRHFATMYAQYDADDAQTLLDALDDAVVYNRYTSNLSNLSGLSVLVPYTTRSSASTYLNQYDTQGLTPQYTNFVRSFLDQMGSGSYSFSASGVQQQSVQSATVDWFSQFAADSQSYYDSYNDQPSSTASTTPGSTDDDFSLDSFLNALFSGEEESFDTSAYETTSFWDSFTASEGGVGSSTFDSLWGDDTTDTSTVTVAQGDQTYEMTNPFADADSEYAYSLNLSKEDLQYLATAEANLMMDMSDPDFECYVDLGYTQDVIIDWNQGKLYGLFDGTWPTLDGQMVCIYDQIANENYVRSLIPVTLNGSKTYLLVVFDAENPSGVVVGSSVGYNDAGIPVRGYELLAQGDIVIPQYELIYWDENGDQQAEPFEGEPITVGMSGFIDFGYDDVEAEADYVYGFCLTDTFGEYQFSDFIDLSF